MKKIGMYKLRLLVLSLVLMAVVVPNAFSNPLIQTELPSNAYITKNGYDWAWIFAVAPDGSYAGFVPDFSFQAQFGWRLPTPEEMELAPSALDFLFVGANVPLGNSDPISGAYFAYPTPTLNSAAALATGYFVDNPGYNHGDWANAPGSGPGHPDTEEHPWWGQTGAVSYSETLAIRPVPEPTTMLLLGFGLVGIAGIRRKFKN